MSRSSRRNRDAAGRPVRWLSRGCRCARNSREAPKVNPSIHAWNTFSCRVGPPPALLSVYCLSGCLKLLVDPRVPLIRTRRKERALLIVRDEFRPADPSIGLLASIARLRFTGKLIPKPFRDG